MNVDKVIADLAVKYPGKRIVRNGKSITTEIVCETEPAKVPNSRGIAVAVIDRSEPHYHKLTVEHYRVIKGGLTIFVNGKPYKLEMGDGLVVEAGQVHCATGDETWVEVVSDPGWNPGDHFLAGQ